MVAKLITFLFLNFSLLLQFNFSVGQNPARVAYWSAECESPVSSIDSTLFTHFYCAFTDLNPVNQARLSSFTSPSDPETQTSEPSFQSVVEIHRRQQLSLRWQAKLLPENHSSILP
ncbi:hypothetical protein GQ457_02G009120 [Hibiscus cannabinus]